MAKLRESCVILISVPQKSINTRHKKEIDFTGETKHKKSVAMHLLLFLCWTRVSILPS